MRRARWLVTILALLYLQPLLAEDVAALRNGVVRIKSAVEGKTREGTGFIVKLAGGSAFVVTAYHTVAGDPNPKVEFFSQQHNLETARQLNFDERLDVVLLKVKPPPGAVSLALARSEKAQLGQDVWVLGFPPGGRWIVTKENVSGQDGLDLMISSANIGEGNSGGPMIRGAQVVGMVRSVVTKRTLVTPIHIVVDTLAGWGVDLPQPHAAPAQERATATAEAKQRQPSDTQMPAPATISGEYVGRTWSTSPTGESYVCDFVSVMSQQANKVTGEWANSCGDRGTLVGEIAGDRLNSRLTSTNLGYACDSSGAIAAVGGSWTAEFVCDNGLRGKSMMNRR